jgi:replicative DNA helicase
MITTLERVLPHNLEAERSVLGAVLIDNQAFPFALATVSGGMFYRDAHRRLFEAIGRLEAKRVPMELVTLREELTRAGELDEVGGPAYVASLVDGVPHATNVEYYARIVREKWQLRQLIFASNKILARAYEASDEASAILDGAERDILGIGRASARGDFVLASDWFLEVATAINLAADTRQVVTGVPSGLPTLDRMTRGFQPADLIYLGARPSTGKTSLALQLALEASRHVMTGFVSMEMSRKVVGFRAVALEAAVDAYRLMTGHLNDLEQQRVGAALARLGERRLAIDDSSGQTATGLRGKVRRLAQRYGLGACFIDYMQLLRDGGREAENRNQELSAISASLKDLARELDLPIVVLSQLSRDMEKQGNRRPRVSDLRDSGALEQDADVVLMLWRPKQHEENQHYTDGEPAELIVGKQRNGPTGVVKLQWRGEQMRFAEEAEEPQALPPEPTPQRMWGGRA